MAKRYYNETLDAKCKAIKVQGGITSYPQRNKMPCGLRKDCESTRYGCSVFICHAPETCKHVKSQDKK